MGSFETSRDEKKIKILEIDLDELNEQMESLAIADGISVDELRTRALSYYAVMRQYEDKGYKVGILKRMSGKTKFIQLSPREIEMMGENPEK